MLCLVRRCIGVFQDLGLCLGTVGVFGKLQRRAFEKRPALCWRCTQASVVQVGIWFEHDVERCP